MVIGVVGFERALGRRRRTFRGLSVWLEVSPGNGLRSGEEDMRPWPGADEERGPDVLTCGESFSRDAVALLDSGGREGSPGRCEKERTRPSPDRSESDGWEMEPDGVCFCFAGLLMRRLRSRWPLASEEKPDDLCWLENDRAPCNVCEEEGIGLGV